MADDSIARGLFERLRAEGWSLIDEWHRGEEAETMHLEFKMKEHRELPEIEIEDKTNIGKTLSAFANAEGGVLVLGVDAGGPGFDKVRALPKVDHLGPFGGALEKRIFTFNDPRIAGLQVLPIADPSAKETGVVAVYVPESVGGPHRVANASSEVNDKYFGRVGASSLVMPHGWLADRFGRAAYPRLSLRIRFTKMNPWELEFCLVNDGRGAARRPAVFVESPPSEFNYQLNVPQKTGFTARPAYTQRHPGRILIEPHSDVVIYPESELVIAYATDRKAMTSTTGAYALTFDVVLHALNVRPVAAQGTFHLAIGEDQAHTLSRVLVLPEDEV